MSTTPRSRFRPGIADFARREWYLTHLDWGLRNLPARDNRHILRDIRRDVTATAADIGMRPALADLGPPRVLAEQYTATIDAEGPRYVSGSVAAGLTFNLLVFLSLAYAFGTLDTLLFVGGGTRTVNLWGSETLFTATDAEISVEVTNVLPTLGVVVVICVVVFLLFSRIWRLRRSR